MDLQRKILSFEDLKKWMNCPGYKDLISFIRQLNKFAISNHKGFSDLSLLSYEKLNDLKNYLSLLSNKINEIKPFGNDKNQRFGNVAYRDWFDQMVKETDTYLSKFDNLIVAELKPYLIDSFGNRQRIDYGTGHELNFIIFLMGLYKLEFAEETLNEESAKNLSQQFLTIFGYCYLPLCRKFQVVYNLEPAGSHGAYSLDDFQYLPFLFGSAELINHPILEPKKLTEQNIADKFKNDYMFFGAINFIFKVKTGPFYEHSNQLWNISGVDNWTKINNGLFKKYCDEVLHKFPIVQHIYFGLKVLKWE